VKLTLCCLIIAIASLRSAAALDDTSVHAAAAYSRAHRGASFLAIQNGRTLLEEYSDAGNAGTARKIYSGTKAFWNLAALAAAQDGLVSLDEPVANTITAWHNDARKSRITIRELLDFSAGLEPAFFIQNTQAVDRASVALSGSVMAEPGTAFTYGPSNLQVFHEVLKAKLHGETPVRFLERRVLSRLGLRRQRYLPDRRGTPALATGWYLTAREWAKLGQLVLAGGSPVVSSTLLAQCWRGSSANRAFSLGWWNNRAAPGGREFDIEQMLDRKWNQQDWSAACICRDAPPDLVACIGSLHQRLYVIPSLQLVVVRHGNGGSFSDGEFLRLLLAARRG
jgi:CubicO group peptidase (beta-lactamase class C family)